MAISPQGRIRINVTGVRGGKGDSSGNLGAGSVGAEEIANSTSARSAILAKLNGVSLNVLNSDDGADEVGHRGKTVSDYLGLAYPPSASLRLYGDSITDGYVSSSYDTVNRYATKLGDELDIVPSVRAVSGGSIMDWMLLQYSDTVAPDQITAILPGFNDQRFVGSSAVFQAGYRAALGAAVMWAGVPEANKIKANSSGVTYSGAWSGTPVAPYTFGRFTEAQNATVTLPPIYGDTINLCVLLQNNFGGVLEVTVDGAVAGTFNLIGNGANGIAVGNGGAVSSITYMPRLIRIPGVGPGAHTVVLKKTDATTTNGGGAVHFLWADSGLRSTEEQPVVLLGDTLTMNATGATSGPSAYNSYTRLANSQFTSIARDVATKAAADGIDVKMVDTHRAWSPVNDPSGDNVHPTVTGHARIASMFARAARGVEDRGGATAGRSAALASEGRTAVSMATLVNGWGNLDPNTYQPASYYREGDGRVYLMGMINGGSILENTTLFVLPVGYRPSRTEYFAAASYNAFGAVRVTSSGEVQIVKGVADWLSLDGISFLTV